ncbi:glycosyltransferase family 2 protein [Pararhizobium sp. BT-229]|uniref:glycosyltransferase family 2 protein n=1 Tax=Pararhizobium sp. BT-229 TaxID=2986923 RepID=UPI0021F7FCBD|nr:glycosyltransferase family 2 protein [Pararhizobium sp. BT-229]MCV9963901.1 glycosyltransferase family 2 protein [Pararhizobium sp. BT-229]
MAGHDPISFVTIVIPVLNEERFILPLLESLGCLGGNRCLPGPHEIIVADGGSTDSTLDILAGISVETGIRVINNSDRIQSAGVNLAAREANPEAKYLIRVDAHAVYEPGFVERVARSLVDTGASSVVVPLITRPLKGSVGFVWAVTVAQRSKLGNGGSAHRLETTPAQWVDHGHHAGFDLEFFRSIGGYDESFATNEDAEYDARVANAGGRIWFEPAAKVWYSPRETVPALARQYFRYGKGRASTMLKHRLSPKARQMFPLAALGANAGGLLGGLLWSPLWSVPLIYGAACLGASIMESASVARDGGWRLYLQGAAALVVMHMCWAAGFACKVCKSVNIIGRR